MISVSLNQTFASPQLHHLSIRDPSVTGEKDLCSLWSLHHYFGAVPLVITETFGLFCHFDHQQLPQGRVRLDR